VLAVEPSGACEAKLRKHSLKRGTSLREREREREREKREREAEERRKRTR
jgi:hypothetical protein